MKANHHSRLQRTIAVAALVALLPAVSWAKNITFLNVSYDPTRELYTEFNAAFIRHWKTKSPSDTLTLRQSHGGSGRQARSVIDGLEADVVTLALAYDIEAIAARGGVPKDWQKRLPNNSSPYTSTIVFLVRKGNPKGIKDWEDLARDGVSVVTPNPKTSGGARWNYLAAWAWAAQKYGNDETQIRAYLTKLFKNVPVLDTGARGSTTTFVQRGIGDVFISWENEAFLAVKEYGNTKLEIINPSLSILAEPPVTWVNRVTRKRGTEALAKAYLEYLYTVEGQTIAAKNFYRPRLPEVAEKFKAQFPELKLVTIDSAFGGWARAQTTHFNEGGVFDQIQRAAR